MAETRHGVWHPDRDEPTPVWSMFAGMAESVDRLFGRSWLHEATGPISVHVGNLVTIASGGFATIVNVAVPTVLIGGTAHGNNVGIRLTVDGEVLIESAASSLGATSSGSGVSTVLFPTAMCESQMLVQVRNSSGSTRDVGWRVYTRRWTP